MSQVKPLRILLLHGSSDLYGASKIFLIVCRILKIQGHQLTICLSEEGQLSEILREEEFEVHIIRLGILRKKYFNPSGILNRTRVLTKAFAAISHLVAEKNIELIYSNTAMVLVGSWVAKRKGIRHIWHLHEITQRPRFLKHFLAKMMKNAGGRFIAVSQEVANHWKQVASDLDIEVLYNGIDYEPYQQDISVQPLVDNEVVTIGMIGRVNRWKGQFYFVDIAEQLNKLRSNLQFLVVGDPFSGDEHIVTELNEYITSKNLSSKITCLGFRDDIPTILHSLDLVVLPSILPDPFPTVILEAMASGKPVAATNHGGAIEMLTEQTGVLIPWDNPSLASVRIKPILEQADLRKKMGDNARTRVLEFFSKANFEKGLSGIINN